MCLRCPPPVTLSHYLLAFISRLVMLLPRQGRRGLAWVKNYLRWEPVCYTVRVRACVCVSRLRICVGCRYEAAVGCICPSLPWKQGCSREGLYRCLLVRHPCPSRVIYPVRVLPHVFYRLFPQKPVRCCGFAGYCNSAVQLVRRSCARELLMRLDKFVIDLAEPVSKRQCREGRRHEPRSTS